MKVLMTGSEGMLGSTMWPYLEKIGHQIIRSDITHIDDGVSYLDVSDKLQVREAVRHFKPDIVFHLAAETDVDKCQLEPGHAFKTNTTGTESVARACKEQAIPIMYVSTAGVFDGDKQEPYTELDIPNPKNTYGLSKLEGERFVREFMDNYFIVRAGWMVGGFSRDKKFVKKVIDQIREGRKVIEAVYDKYGSPTLTTDFSWNIMPLVKTGPYGLYHMANKGVCSRYQVAVNIVTHLGLEEKIKVNGVDSGHFPLPGPRADSEMMCNYRLDLLGMNNMRTWEDGLKEYVIQWRTLLGNEI